MFSGDPQRGEGVDLFGKPLTINSYTFDEFPGALVTRVDYGALSLLGATDPGSGRNILGVRGLHTFESLFGVPVALQGQGVYHQTFGAEMPYQDGASGTICVVPAIGEGVISLQLQGDLRRGEGPNFGVDSNRGDRSEPSWQVLFGLEILR
jgi:hypothetical protein